MFKTKDWRLSDLFRTDGTDSVFSANKSIHKHVQSTSQGDMWKRYTPAAYVYLGNFSHLDWRNCPFFYPTETWLWMFTCSIPPYYGTCVSSLPWLFLKDYTVQKLWIHTQVCLYCCSVISSPLRINTPSGRNWNFLMTYSSFFFNIPLILQFNTN